MADNTWHWQPAMPFRGVNINVHPVGDSWVLEMTPNPLTVSEAFKPRWRYCFPVEGIPQGLEFTLAQHLSLLAGVLEDIAAERRDPVEVY